jgi:hypothetical protein
MAREGRAALQVTVSGLATMLALSACVAQAARAQDTGTRPPTPDEMAAIVAAAVPGPEHERLSSLAGTWDVRMRWMASPDSAVEIEGVMRNRMILGGRFLVSEMESPSQLFGMPVASMTVYGFDRRSGHYTVVGYDTFGTYYVTASGTWDAARDAIVMSGTETDPRTGRSEVYDMVLQPRGADALRSAIIFKMAGGVEATAVEVVATRR